jgi:hypothetical protein
MTHEVVKDCCRFESQIVPSINEISEVDTELIHVSRLLEGYDFSKLKPISKPQED